MELFDLFRGIFDVRTTEEKESDLIPMAEIYREESEQAELENLRTFFEQQ